MKGSNERREAQIFPRTVSLNQTHLNSADVVTSVLNFVPAAATAEIL